MGEVDRTDRREHGLWIYAHFKVIGTSHYLNFIKCFHFFSFGFVVLKPVCQSLMIIDTKYTYTINTKMGAYWYIENKR